MRLEVVGAAVIMLLASTLVSLVPGRGQLLPAQRGNLLVGAAFGTVATARGALSVSLAPARPGANALVASPVAPAAAGTAPAPRSVTATLRCACARGVRRVRLRASSNGTWSARVDLPARGGWFADIDVDGRRAATPVALSVGDAPVRGPRPLEVMMTADLTGPDAARCRSAAQGAMLALGALNARGGVDGGRKIALRVHDDGGRAADAARLMAAARSRDETLALLAPCGAGAGAAVQAARGMPALVADPAVPVVKGPNVWRSAGDPFAEGVAVAGYVVGRVRGTRRVAGDAAGSRVVSVLVARSPRAPARDAEARVAGLRSELRRHGIRVERLPPRVATTPAATRRGLGARGRLATFVDGDPALVARALRRASAGSWASRFVPAPIFSSSALLDERFQEGAGALGQIGAITAPAEVIPQALDARRYVAVRRALLPGERPSIAGLRAYVAGLALAEGLRDGSDRSSLARRLRRPRRFTDALVTPWRDTAPSSGGPLFTFLQPRFLTGNLVPMRYGGHAHDGTFFPRGAWILAAGRPYGLDVGGGR